MCARPILGKPCSPPVIPPPVHWPRRLGCRTSRSCTRSVFIAPASVLRFPLQFLCALVSQRRVKLSFCVARWWLHVAPLPWHPRPQRRPQLLQTLLLVEMAGRDRKSTRLNSSH